jgi:hypothetical protein
MTKFQEREKWEEVNQLIDSKRWYLNPKWLHNFNLSPSQYISNLTKYKFAGKMVSSGANLLEIGFRFGMGIPILSEACSSYLGLESNLNEIGELKENLDPNKCSFATFSDFEKSQSSRLFDSIVMIHSKKLYFQDHFFKAIDSSLHDDGKAICSLEENEEIDQNYIEFVSSEFQKRFKLVVPFFLVGEVVQCGTSKSPDSIIYLGMQKRGFNS